MKASLRTETLTRFKAGANNPLVRRQLKKPLAPGSSPGAGRESPVGERLLCATWERSPAMADFFSTLLGKLWASGRCGQSPTRANCHLVPRIGLAAESSRDSFVGGSTRVKLADASQVGFFIQNWWVDFNRRHRRRTRTLIAQRAPRGRPESLRNSRLQRFPRKLWTTGRCGETETLFCANSDLAPGIGDAAGYSRGSLGMQTSSA